MFKVNDTVIYGPQGVFKITEIRQKETKNGKRDYYVLSPLYANNSTVFVPKDSIELISKIKKIMSPEELREFIDSFPAEKLQVDSRRFAPPKNIQTDFKRRRPSCDSGVNKSLAVRTTQKKKRKPQALHKR